MTGSTEIVSPAPEQGQRDEKIPNTDDKVAHLEQTLSGGYTGKDFTDFTRVDDEVAKYASEARVVIDEATNTRLRRLIDRRVLIIMVITYFLQALDKGTLSFASIMGIQKYAHLVGQQVCDQSYRNPFRSVGLVRSNSSSVLVVDNVHLHRYPHRRISYQLDHPACSHRQVSLRQYRALGNDIDVARCRKKLYPSGSPSHTIGHL